MRWLRSLLFASLASVSAAATFTWTGGGDNNRYDNPANWDGGIVPPNDGTATVVFGNQGAGTVELPFFGILNLSGIQFQTSSSYAFSGLALINVNNGLDVSASSGVRIFSGIVVNLAGSAQTISVSSGSVQIDGVVLGSASLTKTGSGNLVLSGLNLYSGGTQVQSGSLTFTSLAAIPNTGRIASSAGAYVGVTFNDSVQAGFLDQIDSAAFFGAIGLDTAAGQSSPAVYSEQLDLRSLNHAAGLGSQTSARITGEIKINSGTDYRFSGGAGTLYVESDLSVGNSNIDLRSDYGSPLTLVLRGSNSFKGQVNILNSVLVLDSAKALPGTSPFLATRRLNLNGPGYAGYTENFAVTPAGFLSRINTIGSTQAIVGIDSASTAAPRTVSDAIDLSMGGTRTDPYYLGTSTRVTLTGDITPTVGDDLYLTAVKGGHLTVASTLGSNIPGVVIGQTNSFDPQGGTVELKGNNTYKNGTQVLGGTLIAGSNSSLGLGGVTVADRATLSIAPSVLISNSLTLTSGSTLSGYGTLNAAGGTFIGSGVHLSPGSNTQIGTLSFNQGLTLGAGGSLTFNLLSPTGSAGSGWDLVNIIGNPLTITATAASPFTIDLVTISPNGAAGPLAVFDPTRGYSWTFAASNQINGFSSEFFAVNSSGFLNNTAGGSFFVVQNNTGLSITFTPVPEPSTYLLMALGLGLVAIFEYRRRK
ncbi:MAG: autotransporter-associated beta strand repeat-containing protein [Nibricoccus sp.]